MTSSVPRPEHGTDHASSHDEVPRAEPDPELEPSSHSNEDTLAGSHGSEASTDRTKARELDRGDVVGRFVILRVLGRGAMGVVYAAYDPQLDRNVALKLIRPGRDHTQSARARLVREAQALAKLTHPNVVTVHDVGTHEGQVWLSMELVVGTTLGTWVDDAKPGWTQVLHVLQQAASGVAAAHQVNLLHRDLKPDNIMVGPNGRAWVMDFGLARVDPDSEARTAEPEPVSSIELTARGAIIGTPAYMAPEQFAGQPANAHTDQFSLCATFWEVLYAQRAHAGETFAELAYNVTSGNRRPPPRNAKVPGWLRRVLARGMSTDRDERYASIDQLRTALDSDPTRARSFVGLGVATLVGAGLVLTVAHVRGMRAEAACEGAGDAIDEVWNDEVRARVRAGILETAVSYAPQTAERVLPLLDTYADQWREQRSAVCRAHDEAKASSDDDPVLWCLEARHIEFATLLDMFVAADEPTVQTAVYAVTDLAPVSLCADASTAPPSRPAGLRANATEVFTALARARTMITLGDYDGGLEAARAAGASAQELGWPPVSAAARQLEGEFLDRLGTHAEAETVSVDAYVDAVRAQAWDVAAAAATELVFIVGHRQARHVEGMRWAQHAELALGFTDDPSSLNEAHRLSNLGAVHFSSGAFAESQALHEEALALRERALGEQHPSVLRSLNNLAAAHGAAGEYADARALSERALAIGRSILGPDHPAVADSLNVIALISRAEGDLERAHELHTRVLELRERALGPTHPKVADSLNNLASAYLFNGEYDEAEELLRRALAIRQEAFEDKHPVVADSLSNLAAVLEAQGEYGRAIPLYQRALEIREEVFGPKHPSAGDVLENMALTYRAQGSNQEAVTALERALLIREQELGLHDPDTISILARLAGEHYRRQAYEDAKSVGRRALARVPDMTRPASADLASAFADAGTAALEHGQPTDAVPLLEQSLTLHDEREGTDPNELERRFALAQAIAQAHGDLERARAEARTVATAYREADGETPEQLAEVEAFLESL